MAYKMSGMSFRTGQTPMKNVKPTPTKFLGGLLKVIGGGAKKFMAEGAKKVAAEGGKKLVGEGLKQATKKAASEIAKQAGKKPPKKRTLLESLSQGADAISSNIKTKLGQ